MKEKKPKTHGTKSKLISIRMPYEIESELKRQAKELDKSWHAFLKEILMESLGLSSGVEVTRKSSDSLISAQKKIR